MPLETTSPPEIFEGRLNNLEQTIAAAGVTLSPMKLALMRQECERIADKVARSPEWKGREYADDAGEDADAFEEVPVPAGDDTPF